MAAETSATAAPDLRREQMLRAAAEIIGERGFSETRIADVARRVGASPALVIYYFSTKDKLLTEALRFSEDAFYARRRPRSSRGSTARQRLELLVRLTCIPQGDDEIPGCVGAVVRPVGAGVPAPRGRQGPHRARPALARHHRRRRARRSGSRRDRPTSMPTTFAITFAVLLDGLSIQVALRGPGRRPRPGVRASR